MSTRVLQAARSAVLALAPAALVGTTSGQVKPSVPEDYDYREVPISFRQ